MKLNKVFLALLIILAIAPALSFAQSGSIIDDLQRATEDLEIDIGTSNRFFGVFFNLLGLVRALFWIVAVVFILFAAYLYLFEGASSGKVDKANTMLKYAVIAIIVALVATSIPFLIRSILTPSSFF